MIKMTFFHLTKCDCIFKRFSFLGQSAPLQTKQPTHPPRCCRDGVKMLLWTLTGFQNNKWWVMLCSWVPLMGSKYLPCSSKGSNSPDFCLFFENFDAMDYDKTSPGCSCCCCCSPVAYQLLLLQKDTAMMLLLPVLYYDCKIILYLAYTAAHLRASGTAPCYFPCCSHLWPSSLSVINLTW